MALALTLQNGLGNREILAQVLGAERVALGVTTAGRHAAWARAWCARPAKASITLGAHPRLAPLADAAAAGRLRR